MADPTLTYIVTWVFPDGYTSQYVVSMRESQAKRVEEFLETFVKRRYLNEASVQEAVDKPLSLRQLSQVLREEFPRAAKEWLP